MEKRKKGKRPRAAWWGRALAILCCLLFLVPVFALGGKAYGSGEKGSLPSALTLHDALGLALKKSPLLASKKNELSASHHGVRQAKGSLLPRLDAYSSYTRLSDPQVVVPIKAFGAKPPTFSRDQYRTGVSLRMPIFEGGRLWTNIGLSELREAASKGELSFTRQELLYNVTNAFNQVLFLTALQRAQEETLEALKKLRKDARVRLSVGRIAPVDLMRIDAQVASQEHDLAATRQEKERARQLLAALIGMEPWQLGQLKGVLRQPLDLDIERDRETISRLVLERPDIEKAKS